LKRDLLSSWWSLPLLRKGEEGSALSSLSAFSRSASMVASSSHSSSMNSWVLETNHWVRILEEVLLTPGASIILSQLHPELILEPVIRLIFELVLEQVFEVVLGLIFVLVIELILELALELVLELILKLVFDLVLEQVLCYFFN
jgi:hypothetical protein